MSSIDEWERSLGRVEIDWDVNGDEWLHRITKALVREVPKAKRGVGIDYDDTRSPTLVLGVNRRGNRSAVHLLADRCPGGLDLRVASSGVPDGDLVPAVQKAVDEAKKRMGRTKEFEWTAAIGHPAHRAGFSEKRLIGPGRIGGVRLESSDSVMIELRTRPSERSSYGIERSVPIVVRGRSSGFAWEAAQMDAARQLRQVCGLLSLPWPLTAFEVKVPPQRGREIYIPAVPPYTSLDALHLHPKEDRGFLRPNGERVEVPEWLVDAPSDLAKKPWLDDAISIYLEGAYAQHEHPSLALICFVAAVESVASHMFDPERCPTCGTRRNLRRTYTEGLRVLLGSDQAAWLTSAYRSRSRTAHAGRLHGFERLPGITPVLDWSGSEEVAFRLLPSRAERAAREVLVQALRGGLPPRRPLPDHDSSAMGSRTSPDQGIDMDLPDTTGLAIRISGVLFPDQ